MARICTKSKILGSYKNKTEPRNKFNLKLQYPPVIPSEEYIEKIFRDRLTSLNQSADPQRLNTILKKENLQFKCNFEEKMRRVESRRKKIIQRLKRVYRINVESLGENSVNEIIRHVRILEKKKKEREKKAAECTLAMITKLLEEQKYKRRGTTIKFTPKQKKLREISPSVQCLRGTYDWNIAGEEKSTEEETDLEMSDALNQKGFRSTKFDMVDTHIFSSSSKRTNEGRYRKKMSQKEDVQNEENENLIEGIFVSPDSKINTEKPCMWPRSDQPVPVEKCLQSSPRTVVFKDYKKGKVYLKTIRITNIGTETIHCRYLGILVHVKAEERFPVGVAVRDNVKLRPGFSFSTKIRLCCQNNVDEQECSVLYETRRQNKPLQHSCFFIPVKCKPARAILKVSPLKIRFPSLTWCSTKDPENSKLLKKILKIENEGGESCSCRIIKLIQIEETPEEEGDRLSQAEEVSATTTNTSKRSSSPLLGTYGEGSYFYEENLSDTVENLLNELLENVFETFRFSKRYHIEIGPFSFVEIEVKFIPEYKGFHQEKYVIEFRDCYSPFEETIEITGDIKKLPISVEPELVDLRICTANSGAYAATFNIFNNSKGPYSVSLKIPAVMRKHAHVYPRSTIIQAMTNYDFSVKLYPRPSLMEEENQYFNKTSGILEFPVYVHPANTNSCKSDFIKIHVFALITDYELELSPSNIDFGTVSTLETFRTEILLTNHSLTAQEYGFLNLPKEVRVEPNMGFGWILPKESIPLYIFYSPGAELTRNTKHRINVHNFQIKVTSIAERGGLREKFFEEKMKSDKEIWPEEDGFEDNSETIARDIDEENTNASEEKENRNFEECKEYDSLLEEEDSNEKLQKLEDEIRNFLRDKSSKISSLLFSDKPSFASHTEGEIEAEIQNDKFKEIEEEDEEDAVEEEKEGEEEEEFFRKINFKPNKNIINCRALAVEPYCQVSESVIQLPATPYSSVSTYRFRLNAFNESLDDNCTCGTHMLKAYNTCNGEPKFKAAFQFQYSNPHITFEPQSGYLKAGQSIPINIIYRPEFPVEKIPREIRKQMRVQEKSMEKKINHENNSSTSQTRPQKMSQNFKKSSDVRSSKGYINSSRQEQQKYSLSAEGDRNLSYLVDPFFEEVNVTCVVKTTEKEDNLGRMEIHKMILVCPCIKPNFVYLGNSREIDFHKVYVGCKSKIQIEAQNISLKRMSPSISLFNPVGSFSCANSLKRIEVDPEHVWYYTLVYSPTETRGVEKEYFEIQSESTNIHLMVKGQAIEPKCRILPTANCYVVEVKPGKSEEIKIDIENLSAVNLPIRFIMEFVKEGNVELDLEGTKESSSGAIGKEKSISQTEGRKRKMTDGEIRKMSMWDEVPEGILKMIEDFSEVDVDANPGIFTIVGVDDDQRVALPPLGKSSVRIHFSPSFADEKDSGFIKNQAAKFKIMLDGSNLIFKEVTIICVLSKFK